MLTPTIGTKVISLIAELVLNNPMILDSVKASSDIMKILHGTGVSCWKKRKLTSGSNPKASGWASEALSLRLIGPFAAGR
ncbi:hypothetical protein [Paraburkholderia sp.]|uniref:hypothetical protein n=1 Tax=Paraburkholderia sp. TaxID=1926495 RepID=UPI0039E50435